MSELDKDERIAQILETDVTREQLAEVVWSMERGYAGHVELIKELMDERAALRAELAEMVEVVRCGDCVWASRRVDGVVQCGISRLAHMADHYCADGVREVVDE